MTLETGEIKSVFDILWWSPSTTFRIIANQSLAHSYALSQFKSFIILNP